MLFNSFVFLFAFLPVVLAVYWYLVRAHGVRPPVIWLVLASFAFYGYWNPLYLPILVGSVMINYALSSALVSAGNEKNRRLLLFLGVGFNLALLAVFKYRDFIAEILTGQSIEDREFSLIADIGLPIGISFYTFQQIAFLVDVYRTGVRYCAVDYVLFISFFPQLIAGPIVQHNELIPQIARIGERLRSKRYAAGYLVPGAALFAIGLAKKTVLADTFGSLADVPFGAASAGQALSFFDAWGGTIAYGLQIYFDFSAYSDMAIGLGLMFGFVLPLNFNSPYQATSIIDFWRRWHITLSRFLRAYLYIPLGGNRKGPVRQNANLMTTMLLGGLWHGAGWTFILWGGLHGLLLVLNHLVRSRLRLRVPKWLAVAVTLSLVLVAWVPFRADTLESSWAFYQAMFGAHGIAVPAKYGALIDVLGPVGTWLGLHAGEVTFIDGWRQPLLLLIGLVLVLAFPNAALVMLSARRRLRVTSTWWGAAVIGLVGVVSLGAMYVTDEVVFLYFQF